MSKFESICNEDSDPEDDLEDNSKDNELKDIIKVAINKVATYSLGDFSNDNKVEYPWLTKKLTLLCQLDNIV